MNSHKQSLFSIDGLMRVVLYAALAASAQAEEQPKLEVSYDQHIKPILREHCWACHKQGSAKAGLALDSYAGAIEGGSGGEVLAAGDLDDSRLWQLVAHLDEPAMPPDSARLPENQLSLIREWIEGGLLDRPGGARQKKATGLAAMEAAPVSSGEEGPIPDGLLHQPVVVTHRGGAIPSVAASPNAPVIAVAGQRQILLYHAQDRVTLGILPFAEGMPLSLRFSHAVDCLIAAGGKSSYAGRVTVYDVATGDWLSDFGEDSDAWLAADISADRKFIAAGGPTKVVYIISTATGENVTVLKRHTDWIQATAYSSEGSYLATGDRNGGIWLWETPGHREFAPLNGHKDAITALDWRPDGKVLASASEDGTIKLWAPGNGKPVRNWEAHGEGTLCVRWTRDGRLISVGRDKHVKLWDAAGKLVRDFGAQPDITIACASSHDTSVIASADWLGNLHFWNVGDEASLTVSPNPRILQEIAAARATELQQADLELANANREMELIATARQASQTKFDDMLKEAVATEASASTATDKTDSDVSDNVDVLRQLGELTVELELLGQREPDARAAVAAAQEASEAAQAANAEIQARLDRFVQRGAELEQLETQAAERVATIEKRLQQRRSYQAELTKIVELATQAATTSRVLDKRSQDADTINKTQSEIQALIQSIESDIEQLIGELDQATLELERAAMRLKLYRLHIPQ